MKIRIQLVIEDDENRGQPEVEEIACLSRDTEQLHIEQLGLSLGEAKDILATVQSTLIIHQAAQFIEHHRYCQECGTAYLKNGTHHLTVRTLFGTVKLASQRFSTCACQSKEISTRKSFSPLAQYLPEANDTVVPLSASQVVLPHELWTDLFSP